MLARALRVAHRATAADGATKLVIVLWMLSVAVRLAFINQPYVDHWSWRQSDVAAIARNFFENGFRFAYPQIDWAGNATGYVGTEFPILSFIAAVSYKFAGVHEWIGRSQALLFFAVSLPFFFLLVREIFGSTAAVWATFFFSFAPLNIFAGRSFMPDVPSLSLSIVGLYFFVRWLRDGEWIPFFIAAIAISLSVLIKVTSIVIAAPLLYLECADMFALSKAATCRRTPKLLLFAAIALLPSAIWYWHSYQLAKTFYPHHFFGAGGVRIESLAWYWRVAQQTATSSLTPVLTLMAFIGFFVVPCSKRSRSATAPASHARSVSGRAAFQARYSLLFHWWFAAMILFMIVIGYGNRHRWYQLPLVPIAAVFAGAACGFVAAKISSRIAAVMLSILLASSFAILSWVYVGPLYEASAGQLRDAGLELIKITVPDALIVAGDTGDPTIFYYAHRKGWHFLEENGIYGGNPADSREAIGDLEELRQRGATHFVLTTNTFWWLDYYPEFAQHLANNADLISAAQQFRIYLLK